jgi:RNA recognition motif-containing protein
MELEKASNGIFELYVNGISYDATDDDLLAFFNTFCAAVSVNIFKEADGRSKGVGFVTVKDQAALDAALLQDNIDFLGRYLNIK